MKISTSKNWIVDTNFDWREKLMLISITNILTSANWVVDINNWNCNWSKWHYGYFIIMIMITHTNHRFIESVSRSDLCCCGILRLHIHRLEEGQQRVVLLVHWIRCLHRWNTQQARQQGHRVPCFIESVILAYTRHRAMSPAWPQRRQLSKLAGLVSILTFRGAGGERGVDRVSGGCPRLFLGDFSVDPVFKIEVSEQTCNPRPHVRDVAKRRCQ